MKKYLLILAVALGTIAALSACGSKDKEPEQPATATYQLVMSADAFDAANYIIYYKDADNVVRFESLTQSTWAKTVSTTKFPAEFGFKIIVSTKTDAELTKETYDLSATGTIRIARGSSSFSNSHNYNLPTTPVAKNKVSSEIEKGLKDKVFGYSYSKDGNPSENSRMKF